MLRLFVSLSDLALVSFLQIIRCTTFSLGGFLLKHVVQNCCELMGRGGRGLGWPQFAAHAAIEGSEIARTLPQTLRRHASGAPGPIVDPATARREHFAATHPVVGTEP